MFGDKQYKDGSFYRGNIICLSILNYIIGNLKNEKRDGNGLLQYANGDLYKGIIDYIYLI
jgi:hypothetical protein